MISYAFWNNKGGTGKTSIAFQTITKYSEKKSKSKILVIDLCPQSNLSELLLGGLLGNGSDNLLKLYETKRKSVGGYFQDRLPTPFTMPSIDVFDYIVKPNDFNKGVPENLYLLAGDPIVELQANAIATLANTQLPGTNTWIAVIDWIRDFINRTENVFDTIFIDCNPSFSIYTQIAISSVDRLLLPVMADDSSRRALQNVFSLVYGVKMPSAVYEEYSFATKLKTAKRKLPAIHLIIKNRLTQYMGPASAYYSVLTSIDKDILDIIKTNPKIFSFSDLKDGIVNVRDFQTTGIVSFAEGKPFYKMTAGVHRIFKKRTRVRADYLENCIDAIEKLTKYL